MNAKTIEHNKIILQNTLCQTFTFHAKDIHFKTCPPHFKLQMVPSQHSWPPKLSIKKDTLIEFCKKLHNKIWHYKWCI